MYQNKGHRKQELFDAIREAHCNQIQNISLGRLEHTDIVEFPRAPEVKLRYQLFAAPCMLPVDEMVGISQESVDSILHRIECGDIWAWALVTMRVDCPTRSELGYSEYTLEAPITRWGVRDFLTGDAGALYTAMQIEALRRYCEQCMKLLGTEDRSVKQGAIERIVASLDLGAWLPAAAIGKERVN